MDVVWLSVFAVQLVFCLYLGRRVASRTGRSLFNWLMIGFLASIPPIVGPVLMVVCVLWYPPRMTRPPLRGANPNAPDAAADTRTARRPDATRRPRDRG